MCECIKKKYVREYAYFTFVHFPSVDGKESHKVSDMGSWVFIVRIISQFLLIIHREDKMSNPDHNIRNRERASSGVAGSSSTNGSVGDKKGSKLKDDYATGGARMKRGSSPKRGLYFLGVCLLGFLTWSFMFSGTTNPSHSVTWWDENVHLRFGFQKLSYAVIIDAGSTGTRVLGFEFHQSLTGKNTYCTLTKLKATLRVVF